MDKSILLIGFYNEKALGIKYLANKLIKEGYKPYMLFFKEFNSVNPSKASEKELELLEQLIRDLNPTYIGLSVMTSLYLETVHTVNNKIRDTFHIPVIWGGVYATLFPEECSRFCDYVIKGEGEESLVELLNSLDNSEKVEGIGNLAYIDEDGLRVNNDVVNLVHDLDSLGFPTIGGADKYYIYNDTLTIGDKQLDDLTYELSASRGCPFACSYCSSINLKRVYSKKGKFVRFRSVDSVMEELIQAKSKMKKLKLIHFWDEIFASNEEWVDEFAKRYKEEIGLPFRIWGHPLMTDENIIKKLVDVGLQQSVVGIQSGSPRIRKEVFHRTETQEEIIESSKVLSRCNVPVVIYDLMLGHPFETVEDLKETFELCMKLELPFELQIHGLNFLPGTDIVDMALKQGLFTEEEMNQMMYGTIKEQYDMYWGPAAADRVTEDNIWISLIFLTQFKSLRPLARKLATDVENGEEKNTSIILQKIMKRFLRFKDLARKAKIAIS